MTCILLLACIAQRTVAEPLQHTVHYGRGKHAIGVLSGYGLGLGIFGAISENVDVRIAPIFLQWRLGLTDTLGDDCWCKGNLDLAVEAAGLYNARPRDGHGLGLSLGVRYNFLTWSRLVFSADLGGGVMHLHFDLDQQADDFNFTLYHGLGFDWHVAARTALSGGLRLHHISNASIRDPNFGINTLFVLFGVTFFLP